MNDYIIKIIYNISNFYDRLRIHYFPQMGRSERKILNFKFSYFIGWIYFFYFLDFHVYLNMDGFYDLGVVLGGGGGTWFSGTEGILLPLLTDLLQTLRERFRS